MKRAALILWTGILLFAGISCSDKFLEKNDTDWYSLSDTLFLTDKDNNVQVSYHIPLDKDSDFTIFMQPRWLSFQSMHGTIQDGNFTLEFIILSDNLPEWYQIYYSSVVLDVEDFGMIVLTVAFTNYGRPILQCSPSALLFESANRRDFEIINAGQGLLVWEITGKPDWLTVSLSEGIVYPHDFRRVEVELKPEMLTYGETHTGTIMIASNSVDGNYALSVTVTVSAITPPDVGLVTSILTDAEYHHDSGIMAICTKSPNQLLLFNMVSGESDTIPLDKTPVCISLTEDGHKALIGYSVAIVAYLDIDSRQITAEYDIDCIPFDIVPGENGWCYITPLSDQWVMLRNLNLTTGQVITSTTATSIYERAVIRKVPGKPYMAGSQLGLSPTSLLLFDLTNGQAKDAVTSYHESIGHFWLSKNGARLYSAYRNVYTIPEYDGQFHSDSPPVYGNIGSELPYINALDECPAISSVFVSSANYFSTGGSSSLIEQFNITSLNKIKNFNVSPVWLNLSGTDNLYVTTPRFIFVNKEGTAMYVLKTLRQDYDSDSWFMETFAL